LIRLPSGETTISIVGINLISRSCPGRTGGAEEHTNSQIKGSNPATGTGRKKMEKVKEK
jgi:hypothetical protein